METIKLCGSSLAFGVCKYAGQIDADNRHFCEAPPVLHSACPYHKITFETLPRDINA